MAQGSSAAVGSTVVCPIIIGRDQLLAQLRQAVDSARDGHARPILIAGEAGMGKSRIVARVQEYARGQGFQTFQGTCFQPDRACPFAPLLDLARTHFTGPSDLGPDGHDLYPLLPDLAPRPDDAALKPLIAAEHQRRQLLAVLVQLFLHHASRQPLLVVIEDLHWSDDDSLDWLHMLIRRAAGHPLLIVLTLRSDEVGPALQRWLDLLNRDRLIDELSLPALSIDDVAAMLVAIFSLSQPVQREFLEPLYDLSQGNPFVVEELLKSLVEAGEIVYTEHGWSRNPIERLRPRIPRSVQHAVQQRCVGLREDARHLLRLAAVAGRRADLGVLQAITNLDDSDLLDLLKELVASQLLVEDAADHVVFRHALTQQAINAELLSRERRAMHQSIANTIEHVYAGTLDRYAADLSDHYYEAEVWDKTLEYSLAASQQARALYSPRAATVHLTRAIEANAHLGRDVPAALYRARGQAYELLGSFEATLTDFQSALQSAESHDNRQETWQLLLDIGFLWTGRDYLMAYDYFHRALSMARDLGDPASIGHSLNRIGNWHANQEQGDLARQHHLEALEIFERNGDDVGIASTLDLLSMATALNGDLETAILYPQRAMTIYEMLDDRHGVVSCLMTMGVAPNIVYETNTVACPIDPLRAMAALEQALALTRDLDWRSGETFALSVLGELLAARGEFDRALDALRHALGIAEEIDHRQWMIQALYGLGNVNRDLYHYARGEEFLRRALAMAESIHSAVWINMVSGDLASLLVAQGDLDRADAILSALPSTMPMRTLGQRLVWSARAEFALAQREPEQALAIVDALYAATVTPAREEAIPRLALLKAEALAGVGQTERGMALIMSAIPTTESVDGLPRLYQLHATLARVASSTGKHDMAAEHVGIARRLIDHLASDLTSRDLVEQFTTGATALLGDDRLNRPATTTNSASGALTAREHEVATMIVEGLTNREIGDSLFVSTRTIETHVANILRKLGFTSRAQIAVWAVEHANHKATTT